VGRVRPLPPSLVSKIAAGEVVERPASVVKELVENSLDAGACQVEVELEDGGLRLVRVVDDGEGMEEEDALLALEEYSTSKIATIQDLSCITTLGFRGEALHAIAAVSRFTLFTSPGGLGTVVKVEGGVLKSVSKKPRSRGTTVEVRDLFFNLRARRRFLRSPVTERSHILQVMKEYILAYPKVRFLLRERGEVLLEALPGDLKERAAALWGLKPKDILSLEAQDGSMRLEGVLAAPPFTRRDARGEFFFVNGRPVKDRLLAGALMEGMRTRLVKGEYPFCGLFLSIPPEDVDVNVHPSKREVKFRRPYEVASLVKRGVAAVLGGPSSKGSAESPSYSSHLGLSFQGRMERVEEVRMPFSLPSWRFLGEYAGLFFLVEMEGDLVLVDKHALHERMLYDTIREGWEKQGKVRLLLVPLEFSMEETELSRLMGTREVLEGMGFRFQLKGEGLCEIKGVPQWFQGDAVAFFQSWAAEGEVVGEEELVARAASLACREAVKAGDALSVDQIDRLLAFLESRGLDLTCPHGRPVAVRLSKGDVERLFKRRI